MAITNPLALPEIREAMAPFLTSNDLTSCVRVCKDWHSSFLPFLWMSIDMHAERDKQPNLRLLKRHVRSIQRLVYQGKVPGTHLAMQFPALRILHLLSTTGIQDTEMIRNRPSLTHLKLCGAYSQTHWTPLTGLSSLTHLILIRTVVESRDASTVWSLFSQLETLEMRESRISGFSASTTTTESWKIRDLTLERVTSLDPKEQLTWIKHCTGLRRLTWIPSHTAMSNPLDEEFAQSLAASAWPELEELYVPYYSASDQQMSLIIGAMRRVLGLSIKYTEPLNLVKTALRPHFPWLKKLESRSSAGDNTSFIIELLKSCPQLESLQMGIVQVRDMFEHDGPWACESSLKRLGVYFKVDDNVSEAEQRMLFERLSKLHRLERLDLSTETGVVHVLDLRQESGLGNMATLTRQEELAFILQLAAAHGRGNSSPTAPALYTN
ncbi:MAG: hypothetical protein J3Q66DRAFT_352736 [Benniella sp.]|nr:MAG: hypothetical protein J3Q66DRAFT_352736 [Benniella sp.]